MSAVDQFVLVIIVLFVIVHLARRHFDWKHENTIIQRTKNYWHQALTVKFGSFRIACSGRHFIVFLSYFFFHIFAPSLNTTGRFTAVREVDNQQQCSHRRTNQRPRTVLPIRFGGFFLENSKTNTVRGYWKTTRPMITFGFHTVFSSVHWRLHDIKRSQSTVLKYNVK